MNHGMALIVWILILTDSLANSSPHPPGGSSGGIYGGGQNMTTNISTAVTVAAGHSGTSDVDKGEGQPDGGPERARLVPQTGRNQR